MCGRFVQVEKPEFYAEHFGVEMIRTETLAQNYNVAPTQQIYAVADHEDARVLTFCYDTGVRYLSVDGLFTIPA